MYYPFNSGLILLFLFPFFYHLCCVSSIQEFGGCETTQFQCGNITAGFPFWGGNRPELCGHPSLELRCNSKNITSLSISNHVYNVFYINHTSPFYTLGLLRADFLVSSFCSAAFNSTTFPPQIFNLLPDYKNLTIYYECKPHLFYFSSYICPGKGLVSAFVGLSDQNSCQKKFTVNVPVSYNPEEIELNITHLETVLRRGIEVTVNTNKITCPQCSLSPSESYELCSKPFPCGDQTSLLYPFWLPGKENCGYPYFKVDCSRGFAELTFSSVKFRILEANYETGIIKLSRLDYINNPCLIDSPNAIFPENFLSFAPHTKMLTIYYGCQNLSFRNDNLSNVYIGELVCEYDEEDRLHRNQRKSRNIRPTTNYFFTRNISSPLPSLRESCKSNISIPTSGTVLNTLRPDTLKKTLEQGYELQLNQECLRCMDSKGACGYNLTLAGFVCYYKDGTYGNSSGSEKINHGTSIKEIGLVSGSVGGVVLLLVLLTLFLNFLRMRETRLRHQKKMKALIPLEHYTYAQVKRMTKSFAEVVGRGGFGVVYRGTLGDGRMVAVKVLKDSKGNGEDFINEVGSMSRTSHLNIVSLLGFCSEGSKRAIIYEFLENGSLDKFISGTTSVNLDWTTLYRIALGVARGLEYLHHGCKTRIVHFDIKPQNVLLDENFCPKVSDFGLAKLCEKKESVMSLLETRGTVGYIAPEMVSRVYGNVSHKSDVYSYGMLILDMIGARNKEKANQASSSNSNKSSMYFPEWVYRDLELGNSKRHIENEINMEDNELAKKMALVGLWCIQPSPSNRPPMNRVVEMMEGSLEDLEVPPRPQIPVQESSTLSEDISVCTE